MKFKKPKGFNLHNHLFTCLILLFSTPSLLCAAQTQKKGKEPQPLPGAREFVQILPADNKLRLEYNYQSDYRYGPWSSGARLKINLRSLLPEWGAVVEAVSLWGPEGDIPKDRFWVRTEETGGEFAPLIKPVPLIRGDLRKPVRETEMEIEVRPAWQDAPGEYQGQLALIPFGPEYEEPKPKTTTTSRSKRNLMDIGQAQPVNISLSIPEIIDISISGGSLSFEGGGPEGTFYAREEMRFKIKTNARAWRVTCKAANLRSDREEANEIPAERIKWERVDASGRVLNNGNLGLETTVFSSEDVSRITPDDEIILRFSINVTMSDVAGSYSGSISLQGITGQ